MIDNTQLAPPPPSVNGHHRAPDPAGQPGQVNRVATVRTRRSIKWIVGGVMLVALAIVLAVGVANKMSDRQEVLVLAKDVSQGHTLTAADLTTARINSDAGLNVLLAADRGTALGKTVNSSLTKGTVLNPNVLSNGVIPPQGMTLVGIEVSADKLPAEPLVHGDDIRLVDTPRDQDNSPVQAPITTNAQVVGVYPSDAGQTKVDVLVPKEEASWVAARAATHRVALILDTRER
ncbi:SAF domain-containing protein [Nocardia sp. IFM 10818]